jgi:hypothetical protein
MNHVILLVFRFYIGIYQTWDQTRVGEIGTQSSESGQDQTSDRKGTNLADRRKQQRRAESRTADSGDWAIIES